MEDKQRRIVRVQPDGTKVVFSWPNVFEEIDAILDEYNGIKAVDGLMGDSSIAQYDSSGEVVDFTTQEDRHARMEELRKEFDKRTARLSE